MLSFGVSHAESIKVNLRSELNPKKIINIYDLKSNQISKLSPLSKLKYFEIQKKWKDCSDLGKKATNEDRNIMPWVLLTWLNCSLKRPDIQKKPELVLVRPMEVLQTNITLLDRGPWRNQLSAVWLKSLQLLIESKSKASMRALEWAFLRPELLSQELRNIYFEKLQSKSLPPSAGSKKSYANLTLDAEAEASQNLETQWSQKKKENLTEAIVSFLQKYPSGRYQKLWRDRLLDSYNSLWDQKSLETNAMLSSIMKLEPIKVSEFALSWHRRADYADALMAAEDVIKRGFVTTAMVWVAARSSLFLGLSEKAKSYFETLIEKHSGTEEANESLFRLGLLHFRLGNPQQAIVYFEKLLASGKDRGELNTRYWYVRSLQGTQSPQADLERDQLVEDYPYSYYGLKLLAEKNNGNVNLESKPIADLPAQVNLAGESLQTWRRVQTLVKAGWWIEANVEINELPWSQNAALQITWAQWMAGRRFWPAAIRLLNLAFEASPSLKNWELMKDFFPDDYFEIIRTESEKRKIQPRLVQSLIRQESAFGIKAVSTSNALGLMQMIPPTAQEVARQLKMNIQLPDDMYIPQNNIPMGVFYISQMLDEFKGHVPLALASYNAGPVRMKLWLAARPETQNIASTFSTEVRDEIWIDELPWNETSFYVKAILRNILLYQLVEEKALNLKPAFWADLTTKNNKTP